jgi:hypothetical protein
MKQIVSELAQINDELIGLLVLLGILVGNVVATNMMNRSK